MNELYLAGANILAVNQSKQKFDEMQGNIIPVAYRSSMKVVR